MSFKQHFLSNFGESCKTANYVAQSSKSSRPLTKREKTHLARRHKIQHNFNKLFVPILLAPREKNVKPYCGTSSMLPFYYFNKSLAASHTFFITFSLSNSPWQTHIPHMVCSKDPSRVPGRGGRSYSYWANADAAVPAGHTTKHIIFRHLLITCLGLVDRGKLLKKRRCYIAGYLKCIF